MLKGTSKGGTLPRAYKVLSCKSSDEHSCWLTSILLLALRGLLCREPVCNGFLAWQNGMSCFLVSRSCFLGGVAWGVAGCAMQFMLKICSKSAKSRDSPGWEIDGHCNQHSNRIPSSSTRPVHIAICDLQCCRSSPYVRPRLSRNAAEEGNRGGGRASWEQTGGHRWFKRGEQA